MKYSTLRKIIINLISAIALVVVQIGFISGLPGYLNTLNLAIIVLLFILVLGGLKLTFFWLIGIGFLFDLFSFQNFGIYLITFSLSILAINFLLTGFFTDRSLYSFLALTFFATVFYELFMKTILYIFKLFVHENGISIFDPHYLKAFTIELLINLLTTFIIFHSMNYLGHQLKPVFLVRHKNL